MSGCVRKTSNPYTPFNQSGGAAARALDELALLHAGAAALSEVVDAGGGEDSCREGEDEERNEAGELHVSDVGEGLSGVSSATFRAFYTWTPIQYR